jgi:hypothetical protein
MTLASDNVPNFRIGLVVRDSKVSKAIYDFVQWARNHRQLQITHLFLLPSVNDERALQTVGEQPPSDRFGSIASAFMFKVITAAERVLLSRNERYRAYLLPFDLHPLVAEVIHLSTSARTTGDKGGVSLVEMARINSFSLDLLIDFTNGTLPGGLASAARVGTISIRYGNDGFYRSAPSGFWEVYFQQDTTGFTLHRLVESGHGNGEIVFQGCIRTNYYYLLNRAALWDKSIHHLRTIVEEAARAGRLPDAVRDAPTFKKHHGFPSTGQSCVYLARLIRFVILKRYRRLMSIENQWNVAFLRSGWRNADFRRATAIANPPRRYLADPFLIAKDGQLFCFAEDYETREGRGSISVAELRDVGTNFVGIALAESFHLSFPYLFEYRGALYMCPETSEIREIRVYKCIEFPLRWCLERVIIKNISAVDTMLFERNGKWWMLTNVDSSESGDHESELHLFSAESPVSAHWTPHPQNPIMIDATRARNGGLIRDGDRLFRVGQYQGFDFYGKSTSVNEIIRLDEDEYVEQCVQTNLPDFQRGVLGTHHLHSVGETTVFDFVRLGRVR